MHANAIEFIEDIEARIDTNALVYRGICYWPLCRLRLWAALMRTTVLSKKPGDPSGVANTPPTWPTSNQVETEVFGPQTIGLMQTQTNFPSHKLNNGGLNTHALFFVRPEEYSDKVQNQAFAKTIDSVFEAMPKKFSALKVEMADPRTMGFSRHFPSLFLHPERAHQNVEFEPRGVLENFSILNDAIKGSNASLNLDPIELTTSMASILYFARIFEKILTYLGPKVFFLSVYYHNIGMAWSLACRWAGVTSVDLQHGRLGPHHGAYTHLTAAPKDGYHLIPDLIWCWGSQTKHDIESRKNPTCTRHGGIIGSNAWLQKWRYGDTEGLEPAVSDNFAKVTEGKLKILVSLQPLDSPINATLLDAMKRSPKDWLWLIRLHPLRRHTAPEIKNILNNSGINNFEIEKATSLPLFGLLMMVDHHVTIFSSVVIEAAAFGIQTSLIGTEGRDIFKSQIEKRICCYTPNSNSLIDHIAGVLRHHNKTPIDDNFIDMRENLVDRTLESLIQMSE